MIAQSGTMSFYPSLLNWFNNQTGRHSRQATMENPQSPNSQQNSTPQTGAIIKTDQPETVDKPEKPETPEKPDGLVLEQKSVSLGPITTVPISEEPKANESVAAETPIAEASEEIKASENVAAEAPKTDISEETKAKENVAAGTPITETSEVSSTMNGKPERRFSRSNSRRSSYNQSLGRNYVTGSYQNNYGLTHLPYKSNFEPSEAARCRADEFFKTLNI